MDIITPQVSLLYGDCLKRLRQLPENCIDAVVTDPPYGLGFMGKHWDHGVPAADVWAEALRVLKPGGHLLAFAGTRTQHRMCCNIEDAGFEIRDMIAWIYGTGFPKSLDVSKAIDKAAGATREVLSERATYGIGGAATYSGHTEGATAKITAPATPEAIKWNGWGTALKPALEPITVARKPLIGTVAANVLEHDTGGINIDGCRVEAERPTNRSGGGSKLYEGGLSHEGGDARPVEGRWPANLIHDGSEEVLAIFPHTKSSKRNVETCGGDIGKNIYELGMKERKYENTYKDEGSAARFFYCAKASKADRDAGLDPNTSTTTGAERLNRKEGSAGLNSPRAGAGRNGGKTSLNDHPTVKPEKLMRYLCRLVTPPGGVVLDPFMGSGSTGRAALLEGFGFVGVDMDPHYFGIAAARILDASR